MDLPSKLVLFYPTQELVLDVISKVHSVWTGITYFTVAVADHQGRR